MFGIEWDGEIGMVIGQSVKGFDKEFLFIVIDSKELWQFFELGMEMIFGDFYNFLELGKLGDRKIIRKMFGFMLGFL